MSFLSSRICWPTCTRTCWPCPTCCWLCMRVFTCCVFSIADTDSGTHLPDYLKNPMLWFLALTTGSLLFLNTWDFPIYFGLICLAFIIPVIQTDGWSRASWVKFFSFAISYGTACIFLYFPFLVSLSSQAGGFLPSLVFHTRAVHFLVMFFPQIMVLAAFLAGKVRKGFPWRKWLNVFLVGLVISLILFMLSLMIPALAQLGPRLLSALGNDQAEDIQLLLSANQSLLGVYDAQSNSQLITQAIQQFISRPVLVLGLLLAITLIWSLLFNPDKKDEAESSPEEKRDHSSDTFIYLVILMGTLLAIFPEFFYLRDQFGWRMNTIFKFYFQVWILWSLAAAYAVGGLVFLKPGRRKVLLTIGAILVISVGLAYPAFGILDKTNSFRNMEWSLDGSQYYADTNSLEFQAIQYLESLPYGTVAEAIGGSYSSYGRVSKLSGYPTVLGWPGHELQWRGGGTEMGSRENDIKTLYETDDWTTARQILSQYNIRYVFIGNTERSLYQVRDDKFDNYMKKEFSNQDAVIYSWPEVSLNGE